MENYLLIDFDSKSLKKQMKWMNGLIQIVSNADFKYVRSNAEQTKKEI